jgi:branched-chain amino acid transport system substrate-binding protein
MMRFGLLLNVAAISGILLLSACAGGAKPKATASNETIIGVAGPMRGDLAVFGEQIRNGAEAAVQDINAEGGVLGKPLKLVDADDGCIPQKAVQAANDLVDQSAVFVVGHFCSGSSIPASEVYEEAAVLQITPASTNPVLTEDGIRTVFRVTNRDDAQGIFAGTWLAQHYAGKNLAVIDDETPYGRSAAGQTVKTAEANDLTPALMGSFKPQTKDFSDLIARLKATQIDVVYVGGYHEEIGAFVKQARAQGFKGAFAAGDALNTGEFTAYAGSAADGVRFTDAPTRTNLESAKAVVGKFRDGAYPSGRYEPEGYTLNAYAAVQVFAAAAAGTGSTNAQKMADWLRAHPAQTVLGSLSWDAKGDLTELFYTWFVWKNGTYSEEPQS